MEKEIGEITSMLCKEFVNLSQELREMKKEIAELKKITQREKEPAKIIPFTVKRNK